jgi:tetratricopeptide (TPR) repeat protein
MGKKIRLAMEMVGDLKRQGKLQEALEQLERLPQREPGWVLERAGLLARLNRPQEALSQLEQLERWNDYALALKAGLLEHLRQPAESEAIFEELAARPHLQRAAWQRVMKYLQARDPERATQWAARTGQQSAEQLRSQAQAQLQAGHREAALATLEQAHQEFPAHPGVVRDLAMLRLEGEPPEVVVEELETLLSMQDHARNIPLRERLVQALRELKEYERARLQLLECLHLSGPSHYLRANLAYVLRDLGQIPEALSLMEELLVENPADQFVLGAYCKACREHNLVQRAAAFVASQAGQDPRKRRWWGTFKKVCK